MQLDGHNYNVFNMLFLNLALYLHSSNYVHIHYNLIIVWAVSIPRRRMSMLAATPAKEKKSPRETRMFHWESNDQGKLCQRGI